MMFCSYLCRDKTYKHVENLDWMISENEQSIRFEKILSEVEEAFNGHNTLLKFLKNDISKIKTTVFDYDFSFPKQVRMNQIKACLSLIPSSTQVSSTAAAQAVSKGNPLIEKFIKNFAAICERNCISTNYRSDDSTTPGQSMIEGMTLNPFLSLINHSCVNNVAAVENENEIILYAVKPIEAGAQIFLNYL